MTLNIYNELYKSREKDYPFGFLSQREWEKLTKEEKKNTRWMVVESLPKKEQELILWYRDIYYPNFHEVIGNMARASRGKEWENSDNEGKKTLKKTPQISINKISPRTLEKFSFEKKLISEQLPLIVNSPSNSSKKEQILLQKIKQLKEQLKEVQEKNNVLTTKLVKTEKTVHQEKQRANNYHQQLKVIIKSLYQWKKLNYYKQSEQEQIAQIEQLPLKPPNK